jgi:energy-coupling factor transporter transmembrane protein EcfT
MHSGLLIVLWLIGVAALQVLHYEALLLAVGICAVTAFGYAPRRSWRLLKRIRFILIAIAVLFGGFTPGEAVFAGWPRVSPSREGIELAIEHGGRVLAVVFCVAMLMEHLPPTRLVGAIYGLLRPFERFGFPADRVAVRILLVLRLVDAHVPHSWKAWIKDESNDLHDPIVVVRERFRAIDTVFVLAVGGVLLWVLT